MIDHDGYRLRDPASVPTPAMLVYREAVEHNIALSCDLAGGGHKLMVHVKTHKSAEVTRMQLAAGIAGCKAATLSELAMVLEAGAKRAILAYPLLQPSKLERFAGLNEIHPEAEVFAIVGNPRHLDALSEVASRRRLRLRALLDLDVGMTRTGIGLGRAAEELYRALHESDHVEAGGLHVYDGHDRGNDATGRASLAAAHIAEVHRFRDRAAAQGRPTRLVVGGGSYSFPSYAREEGMLGSPGTTVYWDANSASGMPDLPFRPAAFVLTQVVEVFPKRRRFTTDLGSKAIAADPPLERRALLPALPQARLASQSEEHGVFELDGALPEIGSFLLALPGHVCPTTIRYPYSLWIDAAGDVVGRNEHDARDRE